MKKTILLVDDEAHILELLKYTMENEGFHTLQAETGEQALKLLGRERVDAVILDLMLPGIDGLEVLKHIRVTPGTKNLPVLMLTAKSEEFDRVIGLELGADDYLCKPFFVRELVARVKAVLRRAEAPGEPSAIQDNRFLKIGPIEIDEIKRTVKRRGELLELTLKEFDLLRLFAQNPGKVITRDEILTKIWGYDYTGETRTVDVHIRQLRKKIEEDDSNPQYILTVRGVGYKLREDAAG